MENLDYILKTLAISFEQSRRGFDAKAILQVFAKNIGLKPIGKEGATIEYNPLKHTDRVGGMLKGDPCFVLEIGFENETTVVTQAIVCPKQCNKH